MGLFNRFDDPADERAFLRAERLARGRAIQAVFVITALTLISYIVINPVHFTPAGVLAYTKAAALLIALLGGFFLLTRTEIYLSTPWIDLPIFAACAGGMAWLALALAGESAATGFPPHVMVMVQMAILVVFASIAFAGTFRWFLGAAAALLAGFAAWLLAQDISEISRTYTLSNFSTFLLFALYFNWDMERRARDVFAANEALAAEQRKTEALLYNVLPQAVAARLKAGEAVADSFSDVTVIFVDLVGFSGIAKRLAPGHLVRMLNHFFSAADRCAERHGVEKVKTIGDAYLAVAGGMGSGGKSSREALAFARDLIGELEATTFDGGIALQARIGIHAGPVVGGVIGSSRLAYDYWGDTMNVASRLQGCAPPNGIAVSEAVWFETRANQDYDGHSLILKGIGETMVYAARLAQSVAAAD